MLKIGITLSWNNFPFLADCFTHQTSVVFHLRLLRLELSDANLSDGFLREILGPNSSWAFTHFLSLCDVLSVISLHWLLQKRGLQQTSRYHPAWFPQQEVHVLGQNAVTSACLPSYRCSSLHPLVYRGVVVWFKTQVEVWALILGGAVILCQPHCCTCGCGSGGVSPGAAGGQAALELVKYSSDEQ